MLFDDIQRNDLDSIVGYLGTFWKSYADTRATGRVTPRSTWRSIREIHEEPLPSLPQDLDQIFGAIDRLVVPNAVKNTHPLFFGYVTPPSLDIGVLGAAISAILNQNVAFSSLSPIGTEVERKVIEWLSRIVGFPADAGGVLVSGGSESNLYGLAVARRVALGESAVVSGNYSDPRRLRVYCSEHTHHSFEKATMILGLGTRSLVHIPADANHRIDTAALELSIKADIASGQFVPLAIVANAGTRQCCAFDDIQRLREIADLYDIWLHVDAAYGGFLGLATNGPPELQHLCAADSITLDPNKLLFAPYDCGCFLLRDRDHLLKTFGSEGEYLHPADPSATDFASLGMQLGRSFKALKIWMILKYLGTTRLAEEYTRLMGLAQLLAERIKHDSRLELLGPVSGTVVCFRWRKPTSAHRIDINALNSRIRKHLISDGLAFVDENVFKNNQTGLRVCFTNFRTEAHHIDELFNSIEGYAQSLC